MNWQREHHDSRMERGKGARRSGGRRRCQFRQPHFLPASRPWFRRQANHSRVSLSFGESDEGITLRSRGKWVQSEKAIRATSPKSSWFVSSSSAARCNNNGKLQQPLTMASYTLRIPYGYIGVTVTALPGKCQECRHCRNSWIRGTTVSRENTAMET